MVIYMYILASGGGVSYDGDVIVAWVVFVYFCGLSLLISMMKSSWQ